MKSSEQDDSPGALDENHQYPPSPQIRMAPVYMFGIETWTTSQRIRIGMTTYGSMVVMIIGMVTFGVCMGISTTQIAEYQCCESTMCTVHLAMTGAMIVPGDHEEHFVDWSVIPDLHRFDHNTSKALQIHRCCYETNEIATSVMDRHPQDSIDFCYVCDRCDVDSNIDVVCWGIPPRLKRAQSLLVVGLVAYGITVLFTVAVVFFLWCPCCDDTKSKRPLFRKVLCGDDE
jgi:hypothetical protein